MRALLLQIMACSPLEFNLDSFNFLKRNIGLEDVGIVKKAIPLWEVEKGKPYAMVISTNA